MLSNENRDIQRHGKHWAHDTKGRQIKQKHLYSPVKALSVIEKRKSIRKEEKIHCHLRYRYFVTVNQIMMTTVELL